MTLRMLDSIYPANLQLRQARREVITRAELDAEIVRAVDALDPSADAYLGYTDGWWPTYSALVAKFAGTGAHILDCAVFSADNATCSDGEPGDMTIAGQVAWAGRQLARGVWRPVCYRSASMMASLVTALSVAGIARARVRLLTAHYGTGKHICTPGRCGYGVPGDLDGTQWTDTAAGAGGSLVDESLLVDGFFGSPPAPQPPPETAPLEDDMMIEAGNGAETSIAVGGGSAGGISFGCDASRTSSPAPALRVAARSNNAGTWQVNHITLPTSGKTGVEFTASDVGLISVVRESGDDGDTVPVGYNLY